MSIEGIDYRSPAYAGYAVSEITIGSAQSDDELKEFIAGHRRTYLMSAEEGAEWLDRVPHGKVAGVLLLIEMGQWFGAVRFP